MSNFPWLTVILLLPLGGSIVMQVLPRRAAAAIKWWTVAVTAATAVLVGMVVAGLNGSPASSGPLPMHYSEQVNWIPAINASYHIGVDGISAWMLALNAGVFLVGALVISTRTTERLKFFCGLVLMTETATAGVILSVDLLLFYLFWEAMLIPLYFLLANYGSEKRGPATLKFVIYTVAGSLLMLVAIIYLYFQGGGQSFDIEQMIQHGVAAQDRVSILGISTLTPAQWAFLAFAAAFAIKVPLVPFHTWLPDLYESCPVPALMFFAGVVSKLGAYGFIRYGLTLFAGPVHDMQILLAILAVLSILYGALMALSEADIKRIVAYSSISHLGFVALGIFSLNANGLNGAVLQIINHGIVIVALFLVVGMIESRVGTRDRHELSGLERRMPWLYFFFLVITLAGLGFPGMNSFVGEFTIMLGAFQYAWIFAVLAGIGVVLACWYMLRLHQGLMHEPLQQLTERVRDIHWSEGLILTPLVALMVLLGLNSTPIGDVSAPTVPKYITLASGHQQPTSDVTTGAPHP